MGNYSNKNLSNVMLKFWSGKTFNIQNMYIFFIVSEIDLIVLYFLKSTDSLF